VLDTPPQPLHEHVVQTPATAIHADGHPGRFQPTRPGHGGELHPWSVLNTSGRPLLNASASMSKQNDPSRVFDSRQASTQRLYQSMVAAKYMNPVTSGT
jgi:hypothetical protein